MRWGLFFKTTEEKELIKRVSQSSEYYKPRLCETQYKNSLNTVVKK